MAPLVFLMGVGPNAAWRQARVPDLWTKLRWTLYVALATAALVPFAVGQWKPLVALGLLLSAWMAASAVTALIQRLRSAPQRGFVDKLRANAPAYALGACRRGRVHRWRDARERLRGRARCAARDRLECGSGR